MNILGFSLASSFHPLSETVSLSQLSLLKALIDRLLQDETEDLLQAPAATSKTIGKTETHTSNVISEPAVCKTLHLILPTYFFMISFQTMYLPFHKRIPKTQIKCKEILYLCQFHATSHQLLELHTTEDGDLNGQLSFVSNIYITDIPFIVILTSFLYSSAL